MSKHSGNTEKITRTQAIGMLHDLRKAAAASRFGNGQMFRATFVTRGDDKTPSRLRQMVCRYQVTQHLTGGQQPFQADEHALIGVYEMVPRARALKLFKAQAQHEIDELTPQVEESEQAASQAESKVSAAEQAAEEANANLSAAEEATYATKKAKTDAERPLKAAKKEADRALKIAREEAEKARKKASKLASKLGDAILAKDDPETSLKATITARIERLTGELGKTTDADETAAIEKKLEREQELLSDPVKSLLRRYREINLLGLTELKVKGVVYKVTTPPVPALPASK